MSKTMKQKPCETATVKIRVSLGNVRHVGAALHVFLKV